MACSRPTRDRHAPVARASCARTRRSPSTLAPQLLSHALPPSRPQFADAKQADYQHRLNFTDLMVNGRTALVNSLQFFQKFSSMINRAGKVKFEDFAKVAMNALDYGIKENWTE